MLNSPPKYARLEARINPDIYAMIKQAAEYEGRSLTDFIVSAVQQAAQKSLETHQTLRLSQQDQEHFVKTILSPPSANEALQHAITRYQKMVKR